MPQTLDTSVLRRRRVHGFVDRWFRRRSGGFDAPLPAIPPTLIDANTRTFWSRGAGSPATLVEADGIPARRPDTRVRALLDAHARGERIDSRGRPRANPAFTEALFVELMRANQYRRAFAMLADECRAAWGSPERFAAAQGSGPMRRLRGVRVAGVRHLDDWTDPERGNHYRDVAELDVEYTVGSGPAMSTLPRVVHLVSARGRWWSLCYPG